MILQNRDFIFFGLQPWDIEIGCNPRNMAHVIAKHNNRVLYVNRPLDRITYLTNRKDKKTQTRINSWKNGVNELTEVAENIHVLNPRTIQESINFLPQGSLFNKLNYINTKRLAAQINKAVKILHFKNPIIIIDNDFIKAYYLKELVPNALFVYYIRDFLISYPYFKKRSAMMPAFMKKADMVAGNSAYLKEYALPYNKDAVDIGQGCDVKLFRINTYSMPDDLKALPQPLIGYCGALLSNRLDISLIEKIAAARPQWSIVLVGKEDADFEVAALHKMGNVHFLGAKKFDAIPAYVKHFDVCINPQVVNEITIGNYPLKIDEYLAAGKPVVATDTIAMRMFEAYCYLCKNAGEYVKGIEKALTETGDEERSEKRKDFASSHTWEACVEKLYEGMDRKLAKKPEAVCPI